MTLHATATEIQNHERSHTQTIIERPLITIAPAGTLERLEAIQREKQLQNRHMLPYKLK